MFGETRKPSIIVVKFSPLTYDFSSERKLGVFGSKAHCQPIGAQFLGILIYIYPNISLGL